MGAIVMDNAVIGSNSIVAAGAVVNRDVPAGHLAFGNPAQIRPLAGKWLRPQLAQN